VVLIKNVDNETKIKKVVSVWEVDSNQSFSSSSSENQNNEEENNSSNLSRD